MRALGWLFPVQAGVLEVRQLESSYPFTTVPIWNDSQEWVWSPTWVARRRPSVWSWIFGDLPSSSLFPFVLGQHGAPWSIFALWCYSMVAGEQGLNLWDSGPKCITLLWTCSFLEFHGRRKASIALRFFNIKPDQHWDYVCVHVRVCALIWNQDNIRIITITVIFDTVDQSQSLTLTNHMLYH